MFIRKRDPRYKSHKLRQSQTSASAPQGNAARRAAGAPTTSAYVEQAWQKPNQSKIDQDADLQWAAAEAEEDAEEWECVACSKTFRSEAAWDSHERSKKHLQAVERLRREMLDENEELDLGIDGEEVGEGGDIKDSDGTEEPVVEYPPPTPSPRPIVQLAATSRVGDDGGEEGEGESNEQLNQSRSRSKKKRTKQKSRAQSPSPPPKTSRKSKNPATNPPSPASPPDEPTPDPSEVPPPSGITGDVAATPSAAFSGDEPEEPPKQEMSKRDKRRAREAAKKAQAESSTPKLVRFLFVGLCPFPFHQLILPPSVCHCACTANKRRVMCALHSLTAGLNCSPTSLTQGMLLLTRYLPATHRGERRKGGKANEQFDPSACRSGNSIPR